MPVIRRYDGSVILGHGDTVCDCAEEAVRRGISLDRAWLEGAALAGASLEGARLEGARLYGARLEGAALEGARLEGARLEGASLDRASLEGASLEEARLYGASLEEARLDGAIWRPGVLLTGDAPIWQAGPVGSRGAYCVFARTDHGLYARTGGRCFDGTVEALEALEAAVAAKHGNNPHGRHYRAVIAAAREILG